MADVIDLDMETLESFSSDIEPPESDNPLQCRYCGKTFTRSNYRKEHERIHTGEKPYECGFCGRRFNSKGSCNKHERKHMEQEQQTATLSNSHQTRPYRCHICLQTFTLDSVFKKHLLFHTSHKKLFQCNTCPKAYFTSHDLRVHFRTHSGERPYKCHVCNLYFVTGRRRNLHEKCHFRQDTFQCKKCRTIFRTYNSLQLHRFKSQHRGSCDETDVSNTERNSIVLDDDSDDSNNDSLMQEEDATRGRHEGTTNGDRSFVVNDQYDNSVELDIEVLGKQYHGTNTTRESVVPRESPTTDPSTKPSIGASSNKTDDPKLAVFPTGLLRSSGNGIKVLKHISCQQFNNITDPSGTSDNTRVRNRVEERDESQISQGSVFSDTGSGHISGTRDPRNVEIPNGSHGIRLSRSISDGPNESVEVVVKIESLDQTMEQDVDSNSKSTIVSSIHQQDSAASVNACTSGREINSDTPLIGNGILNASATYPSSTRFDNSRNTPVLANSQGISSASTIEREAVSPVSSRPITSTSNTNKLETEKQPKIPHLSQDVVIGSQPPSTVVTASDKQTQTQIIQDLDVLFAEMVAARKVFECQHCGIIFRDYTMFLVHKTLHADINRPLACHLCGSEAKNKVDFNSHLIWHMK